MNQARPAAELVQRAYAPTGVAAHPSAGRGLQLDETGNIPSSLLNSTSAATTLPAGSDGLEAILVDSTSSPTYAWKLVYVASAAKWLFVGGSAAYSTVDTSENAAAANNTYADFTTAGPSFTVPRAGVYYVEYGATGAGNVSATSSYIGLKVGSGTPSLGTDRTSIKVGNNTVGGMSSQYKTSALTASTVLKLQMADADSTRPISFGSRWLAVRPVYLT